MAVLGACSHKNNERLRHTPKRDTILIAKQPFVCDASAMPHTSHSNPNPACPRPFRNTPRVAAQPKPSSSAPPALHVLVPSFIQYLQSAMKFLFPPPPVHNTPRVTAQPHHHQCWDPRHPWKHQHLSQSSNYTTCFLLINKLKIKDIFYLSNCK